MLRGTLHKGAKIILSFGAAAEVLTMRAIYIEKHGSGADLIIRKRQFPRSSREKYWSKSRPPG
jgi:hypothetical protein